MIKNLILDIGNVICLWDPVALSASAFDSPEEQRMGMQATIGHSDWLELDRGAIALDQAISNAQQRCSLDPVRVAAIYSNLPSSLLPIQSTMEAMRRAAAAGVPIYILSNMAAHSWQYLQKHYDCWSCCAGVVVSCEAKLIKPDPAIYQHLTDKYLLNPAECLFVDDMKENIDAAIACGWQGEHLVDTTQGGVVIDQIVKRISN